MSGGQLKRIGGRAEMPRLTCSTVGGSSKTPDEYLAALDEVGLFDPDFPIFFGDVDLCLRMKEAGWEIWYTPDARMTHFGGASTRLVRREMIIESHAGFERFYEKHYRGRVSRFSYHLALGLLRVGRAARLARLDLADSLQRGGSGER